MSWLRASRKPLAAFQLGEIANKNGGWRKLSTQAEGEYRLLMSKQRIDSICGRRQVAKNVEVSFDSSCARGKWTIKANGVFAHSSRH